jgi:hypothetical protein
VRIAGEIVKGCYEDIQSSCRSGTIVPFTVVRTISAAAAESATHDFSLFLRQVASVYSHEILERLLDDPRSNRPFGFFFSRRRRAFCAWNQSVFFPRDTLQMKPSYLLTVGSHAMQTR